MSTKQVQPASSSHQPTEGAKLLILYFNGVSCMGKSELLKRCTSRLLQSGLAVKRVSLDSVAKGIMDEYKVQNNYQGEEAFTLCIGPIFELFHQKIIDALTEIKGKNGVLMVDDCGLDQKFLRKLNDRASSLHFQTKMVCLHPEIQPGFQLDSQQQIALSFQLILNLCLRSLNRQSHPTFDYLPEKKLQLVLSFVKVFDHSVLSAGGGSTGLLHNDGSSEQPKAGNSIQTAFSAQGLAGTNHQMMGIEFHHEKKDLQASQRILLIEGKLKEALLEIVPFESPPATGMETVRELVELFQTTSKMELQPWLSYGRFEIWESKMKELCDYF